MLRAAAKKRAGGLAVPPLGSGTQIKELRLVRDWSQEEFADRAGVHRTYIGSAENGSRNLSIQVLARFARTFGISVSELLVGIEEREEAQAKPSRVPKAGGRSSPGR